MAVRFDNSTDFFNRTATLPNQATLTAMAWVNQASLTGAGGFNLGDWFCLAGADDGEYHSIGLQTSGGNALTYAETNYAGTDTSDSGSIVALNTWHHLAFVHSGDNIEVFLDGVSDASFTKNGSFTTTRLFIGSSHFANALNGRVAGFLIYEAALTAAEIQQQLRQIVPVRMANLWAWYPMTDSSVAGCAVDYSGNGRNLTSNGTITIEQGPPVAWKQGRSRIWIPAAAAGVTVESDVTTSAAISTTNSASVTTSAAISTTNASNVTTSAAISRTEQANVTTSAATSRTEQSDVSSSVALSTTNNASATSDAAISQTVVSNVTTSAALSRTETSDVATDACVTVPGQATAEVTSSASVSTTNTSSASTSAAVSTTNTSSVTSSAAISSGTITDVNSSAAVSRTEQANVTTDAHISVEGEGGEEVTTDACLGLIITGDVSTTATIVAAPRTIAIDRRTISVAWVDSRTIQAVWIDSRTIDLG